MLRLQRSRVRLRWNVGQGVFGDIVLGGHNDLCLWVKLLLLRGFFGMNKAELVNAVASAANLSKADAGRAVDAVVGSVTSALQRGEQVSIIGFGTFSVKHRAARAGRNPRTGSSIWIEASNVPGFKAGKAFKEAVN